MPKRNEENTILELDSHLLDLSLAHYNLDIDDLRGAAILDASRLYGEEADEADERDVDALLGVPNAETYFPIKNTGTRPISEHLPSELQILSQSLLFTIEEVKARYMQFEDLQVTCDFFQQCRRLVDGYFTSYYNIYLGKKSNNSAKMNDVESLRQVTAVLNTSFPAANTRTKTAARKLQVNSKD